MLLLRRLLLLGWRRADTGRAGRAPGTLLLPPASSSRMQCRHAGPVPAMQLWDYRQGKLAAAMSWQQRAPRQSPAAFNRMGFVGCTEPAGMRPHRCMGHQVGGTVISRRAKGQNQGVKAPGPSAPSTGRKISQLTFYVKLIQKLISSTGRIIGFHSGAGPDGQCAESQTHLISTETMPEDRNKTHKDNY